MNHPAHDEYEEVESPFASKPSVKSPDRDRLRTRKNVFNRPFAADSSNAPTYFEATPTRKSVGRVDGTELIKRRASALQETQIEYLEDEEEDGTEVQKSLERKTAASIKRKDKFKQSLLSKIGWSVIGLLILRLICMDRGVWDYFSTESEVREKQKELSHIQKENVELKNEITRIQIDKNFQRQLAKEHLGVIAVDEFLILFAGETSDESAARDRSF